MRVSLHAWLRPLRNCTNSRARVSKSLYIWRSPNKSVFFAAIESSLWRWSTCVKVSSYLCCGCPKATIGCLMEAENGLSDRVPCVCMFHFQIFAWKEVLVAVFRKEQGEKRKADFRGATLSGWDISPIFSSLHFQRLKKLYPEWIPSFLRVVEEGNNFWHTQTFTEQK